MYVANKKKGVFVPAKVKCSRPYYILLGSTITRSRSYTRINLRAYAGVTFTLIF